MKNILLVATGGAFGSVARYLFQVWTPKFYSGNFPLSTFIVNVIGCFLIGVFFAMSDKVGALNPQQRLLLMTGICGGFTTFSAFAFESTQLLNSGKYYTLGIYALGSVIIGIIAVYLGIAIVKT